MRWWWLLFAACDHTATSASLVAGGPLVEMAEGETRTLELASASELGNAPAWATLSADQKSLTLAPPCTLITGTDGPPRETTFDLTSNGTTTAVIVEVQPSGEGTCALSLIGCVHHGKQVAGNVDGLHPCDDNLAPCGACTGSDCDQAIPASLVDIDFVDRTQPPYFSDPTILDRALVFTLVNPDPADHMNLLFSSGAPVLFQRRDADYCGAVPNKDVIASFTLSYIATRGNDATSPAVATGKYQLAWNQTPPSPYGASVEWCAVNMGTCTVKRYFDVANPQWCVEKTVAAARTTLGARVWAGQGDAMATGFNLGLHTTWTTALPDIGLTIPPVAGTTVVTFIAAPDSTPADAVLELGTSQDSNIDVMLQGSQLGSDTLDTQYTQPFHMLVHVGTCQ
jgi:hypothetical protein